MDPLAAVAIQLTTGVIAVWSLSEITGRATGLHKGLLSIVFGPLVGCGAYTFGFLPYITETLKLTGLLGYGAAAFAGLIATLVSKPFHDMLANPIMRKLTGSTD